LWLLFVGMKEKIIGLLNSSRIDKKILLPLLEVPKNQEMGDYALPCFSLSKKLKRNPNEIAKDIVNKIRKDKRLDRVEVSGGYVNFFLNKSELAKEIIEKIKKEGELYGSRKNRRNKVMIEFSQPNTHKAFHIGHVRGTSLGESLSRILEFSGDNVIRANYSGDTGMHIAKWLWCYMKYHPKEELNDEESWFASIYVDAVKRLARNEKLQEEVNEINRKLDSKKDKKLNKLWKDTRRLSVSSWKKIYHELNTNFDVQLFESEVEEDGRKVAKDLVKKDIAEISDGATIVNLEKYGLKVFLLLRGDGTVLYGGKDIALAKKKFKEYNLNKSIYVIGNEQNLYINQVFKTLELMKFKGSGKNFYIPFNEVRLPTGKMSSRTGDNILYSNFKEELVKYSIKEIEKRHKDLKSTEIYDRALAISIAAIKYNFLKQDTNKVIVFDKKEAIKFEGNTGPYLLYSYARALSILEKARYKKLKKYEVGELCDYEKRLVSELARFPEAVKQSYNNLSPSVIAHYSYSISKSFSEFYHNCQVIGSDKEQFRLKLVDSFSIVLKNSLRLLGINAIPKM